MGPYLFPGSQLWALNGVYEGLIGYIRVPTYTFRIKGFWVRGSCPVSKKCNIGHNLKAMTKTLFELLSILGLPRDHVNG